MLFVEASFSLLDPSIASSSSIQYNMDIYSSIFYGQVQSKSTKVVVKVKHQSNVISWDPKSRTSQAGFVAWPSLDWVVVVVVIVVIIVVIIVVVMIVGVMRV